MGWGERMGCICRLRLTRSRCESRAPADFSTISTDSKGRNSPVNNSPPLGAVSGPLVGEVFTGHFIAFRAADAKMTLTAQWKSFGEFIFIADLILAAMKVEKCLGIFEETASYLWVPGFEPLRLCGNPRVLTRQHVDFQLYEPHETQHITTTVRGRECRPLSRTRFDGK